MSPAGLHHYLDRAAGADASAPAYRKDSVSVSYGELATRVRRFAGSVAALGVARGDRVALVLDSCVEHLVAYYGALHAGAAAVALCNDARTDALVFPLANCRARVLVIEPGNLKYLEGQASALPDLKHIIVTGAATLANPGHFQLHTFGDLESTTLPEASDAGASGEELASIIYTSGTTGRPKGVMLAHRSLIANTRAIVQYLELRPSDSVGMVLPYYYSYGNSVLHTHIAAGACITQLGNMVFPAVVVEQLAKLGCTGFSGVPATFARLLQGELLEQHDLSSLRYVTQAGAAMRPEMAAELKQRLPKTNVFVMYGQTEASARLAYLPPADVVRKAGSVGVAIPGMKFSVCDPDGNELPRGTVGELVAEGPSVMLGYWEDPEGTARTLASHGLRTGDVAKMDDEGFVYIIGRDSDMIKSGAHRIAPQEIERVLEDHSAVREVAVVGKPDPLLGESIVAFVVPEGDTKPEVKALQRWCFERLPRFKLPQEIRFATELPKTASGKLTRAELKRALKEETAG